MARVASGQGSAPPTPIESPKPAAEPTPESSEPQNPVESAEVIADAPAPGGWGIRAVFERVSSRRSSRASESRESREDSSGIKEAATQMPAVADYAAPPDPVEQQVVNQEIQTVQLNATGGAQIESRSAVMNFAAEPPVEPRNGVAAPSSLALLDQIIEVSSSPRPQAATLFSALKQPKPEERTKYLSSPDVWSEITSVYEEYLKHHPSNDAAEGTRPALRALLGFKCHRTGTIIRSSTHYALPPATAPRIISGSEPLTTGCGRGAAMESIDKSC